MQEQVKEADRGDTLGMFKKTKSKVTRISSADFADAKEVWHLCAESRSIHERILIGHRADVGEKSGTSGFI